MKRESAEWLIDQTDNLARIRAQDLADELAYVNFRASKDAGDSEAQQRAYFGNDYQMLLDRWTEDEKPIYCAGCNAEMDEDERERIRKGDEYCDRCNSQPDTSYLDDPRHGQAASINARYGR